MVNIIPSIIVTFTSLIVKEYHRAADSTAAPGPGAARESKGTPRSTASGLFIVRKEVGKRDLREAPTADGAWGRG